MRCVTIFGGNYKVYEDGSILSSFSGIFIRVTLNRKGYAQVQLTNGTCSTYLLHTLLYKCFVGPIPAGFEVDHKDADRGNYALGNLQLLTLRDNRLKSYRQNRCVGGADNANSKLTQSAVDFIRYARGLGIPGNKLAKLLQVTPSCISAIYKGKLWKTQTN